MWVKKRVKIYPFFALRYSGDCMKLADSIIKAAKPRDKRYNLADGKGFVLLMTARKHDGCDITFTKKKIGFYPSMSLAVARLEYTRFNVLIEQPLIGAPLTLHDPRTNGACTAPIPMKRAWSYPVA